MQVVQLLDPLVVPGHREALLLAPLVALVQVVQLPDPLVVLGNKVQLDLLETRESQGPLECRGR